MLRQDEAKSGSPKPTKDEISNFVGELTANEILSEEGYPLPEISEEKEKEKPEEKLKEFSKLADNSYNNSSASIARLLLPAADKSEKPVPVPIIEEDEDILSLSNQKVKKSERPASAAVIEKDKNILPLLKREVKKFEGAVKNFNYNELRAVKKLRGYDLILMPEDHESKSSIRTNQLCLKIGKDGSLGYEIIDINGKIDNKELQAQLRDNYPAFLTALEEKKPEKLKPFLSDLLEIISKKGHIQLKEDNVFHHASEAAIKELFTIFSGTFFNAKDKAIANYLKKSPAQRNSPEEKKVMLQLAEALLHFKEKIQETEKTYFSKSKKSSHAEYLSQLRQDSHWVMHFHFIIEQYLDSMHLSNITYGCFIKNLQHLQTNIHDWINQQCPEFLDRYATFKKPEREAHKEPSGDPLEQPGTKRPFSHSPASLQDASFLSKRRKTKRSLSFLQTDGEAPDFCQI